MGESMRSPTKNRQHFEMRNIQTDKEKEKTYVENGQVNKVNKLAQSKVNWIM